jgi:hypothetical protein
MMWNPNVRPSNNVSKLEKNSQPYFDVLINMLNYFTYKILFYAVFQFIMIDLGRISSTYQR